MVTEPVKSVLVDDMTLTLDFGKFICDAVRVVSAPKDTLCESSLLSLPASKHGPYHPDGTSQTAWRRQWLAGYMQPNLPHPCR
jgi:hypothetical protein